MTHLDDDQLVLHYYHDQDARGATEHLAACGACAARFRELKQTLDTVAAPEVPARSDAYGAEVWNRIRAHLPESAPRRAWWQAPPRWAVAGALAALLIAAFLLGRISRPPAPPELSAEQLRQRVLLVALADHLDRSQMLLIELSHASGDGTVDISAEQRRAEELAQSNRLYRQTAQQIGDADMAQVLDQLERVLLDIGHQSPQLTSAEFEQVQKQLESQGILFKVRVVRSKVRNEIAPQRAPATLKGRSTT